MTGSHADAIVLGGRYDGILGVLGGIAAVKGLREAGFQWTSEEADRFTEVCFGRCGGLSSCMLHGPTLAGSMAGCGQGAAGWHT